MKKETQLEKEGKVSKTKRKMEMQLYTEISLCKTKFLKVH